MNSKYVVAMLAAFAMVTAGRWKEGEGLSITIVLGFLGATVGLSAMGEVSDGLADGFAFLIVSAAAYKYVPELVDGKTGKLTSAPTSSKKSPGKKAPKGTTLV
jgi:hypothetical protein